MCRQSMRILLFGFLFWSLSASAVEVVSSIRPVALIVAGVTGDEPALRQRQLISGAASPHHFAMRPSQLRALSSADLVIWAGPALEQSLAGALGRLPAERVLTLSEHLPATMAADGHFWFDPVTVKALVPALAEALAKADPAHAADYRRRASAFSKRLSALDGELDNAFAPVRGEGFAVVHDAYRYWVRRYRLNQVTSLAATPHSPVKARHLTAVAERIRSGSIRCLVLEPDYRPGLVERLEVGALRRATIDPLAREAPLSARGYEQWLRGAASRLIDCLAPVSKR